MHIRISGTSQHGAAFDESFSEQPAAEQFLQRAPHLVAAGARPVESPGRTFTGPHSVPASAPGPETVDFVLQRRRDDPARPAGHMLVDDGSDDTRQRLFDHAARLASGVLDLARAVPACRVCPGPNHQVSVIHDSGGQVIFTLPRLLQTI